MFVTVMAGGALLVPSTVPVATTISQICRTQCGGWPAGILPNLGSRVGCSAAKPENQRLPCRGPRSNTRAHPSRPETLWGCGGGGMCRRERDG